MQKKYKVKNNKRILNFVLMVCIIVSTCMLSVGYAELVTTNLNIKLNVSASMAEEMIITNVQYVSDVGTDLEQSQVDYTGQVLHPNIYLTDGNSSITYEVTIYNNSDGAKVYTGIEYVDDYYSNNQIGYRLDGLIEQEKNAEGEVVVQGSHIHKGESITFNITFYYKDSSNATEHKLDAYLKFGFNYYFDEIGDVDIVLGDEGTYDFAGISKENYVNINDLTNINFIVANGTGKVMTGVIVDIIYNKTSGAKASAKINVLDANGADIIEEKDKNVTFATKGENPMKLILKFKEGVVITNGSSFSVTFDQSVSSNGKLDIFKLSVTPIY